MPRDREQSHRGLAWAHLPPHESPPCGNGEELRQHLCEKRILDEGTKAVDGRHRHGDHAGESERQAERRTLEEPQQDQKEESSLQRDRDGNDRVDGVQAVCACDGSGNDRQEVQAGSIVGHLAEILDGAGIMRQLAVALDVVDEQEMMREIRTAAERQQRRPRQPQQVAEHGGDDEQESPRVGGAIVDRAAQSGPDDDGCDQRGSGGGQRGDAESDPVGQVCDRQCRRQRDECHRCGQLRARQSRLDGRRCSFSIPTGCYQARLTIQRPAGKHSSADGADAPNSVTGISSAYPSAAAFGRLGSHTSASSATICGCLFLLCSRSHSVD